MFGEDRGGGRGREPGGERAGTRVVLVGEQHPRLGSQGGTEYSEKRRRPEPSTTGILSSQPNHVHPNLILSYSSLQYTL